MIDHRIRVYKWMGAQDWYRWECSCGAHQRGGSRSETRALRYGRMHSYNVRRPERQNAAQAREAVSPHSETAA